MPNIRSSLLEDIEFGKYEKLGKFWQPLRKKFYFKVIFGRSVSA